MLGKHCGGNFTYLPNGIKDYSQCLLPHQLNGFSSILSHWPDVVEKMIKKHKNEKNNAVNE